MSSSFLKELAQAKPDPGGGAAAAYGAGLALALLEKVVRLEANRRRPDNRLRLRWEDTLERLRRISETVARLQDEDVQALFQPDPVPGRGPWRRTAGRGAGRRALPLEDHSAGPGSLGPARLGGG